MSLLCVGCLELLRVGACVGQQTTTCQGTVSDMTSTSNGLTFACVSTRICAPLALRHSLTPGNLLHSGTMVKGVVPFFVALDGASASTHVLSRPYLPACRPLLKDALSPEKSLKADKKPDALKIPKKPKLVSKRTKDRAPSHPVPAAAPPAPPPVCLTSCLTRAKIAAEALQKARQEKLERMRRLALLQIGALPPSEVHNLTAADWMALERAGHDVAQLKAWAAAHAPDTGACQTGGAPEATAQTNVSLVELCKHQKEELKRLQVALAVQAAGSDRQALLDKINALESANIVLGRDNCRLVAEKDALLSKDICRNNDMLCEKVEWWMDLEKCRSEKSELAQTLDDCRSVLSDTRCDLEIEKIGRDKTRELLQQALFDATTAQEALGSFKERERAVRLSLMASMAVDAPDSPPFFDAAL